ncbi:MAG TPA: hypothetical protein VJH92_01970 [Candidatus Nanoarchaeia archaeon]|nr:hypothetical protein [Candidatus Nanoarchaeia archaeon]
MALENVIQIKNFDANSNDQRTIVSLLPSSNQSLIDLKQVRIVRVEQGGNLGNHWREYEEIYGIIGEAEFILKDIETGEQKKYEMSTGDLLKVPSRIALRVKPLPGSVIACLSGSYEREAGTHKYFEFND